VLATPGEGPASEQTAGCLQFRVLIPAATSGGTFQGNTRAKVLDRCNDGTVFVKNGVEGEVLIEKLDDGTGLTSLTFPRSYSALFADGALLAAPTGRSDALAGTDKVTTPETPATNPSFPTFGLRYDDTKVGTDYTMTSGGGTPTPPPAEEPEPKPDKEKKKCKKGKGKGKKKGCKKGKGPKPGEPAQPAGCAPMTPAEGGADAPIVTVTDEMTEEAPLEIPITAPAGTPAAPETVFHNLQVDSASADTGLYARYEFSEVEDYDLYLQKSDGTIAAQAAGFNPVPFVPTNPAFNTNGEGSGGHSEQGAEQIDGVKTADCGGYTAQMDSYLAEGGDLVLKVWLGEATYETPAAAQKALV
nr:hypothetical protein [Actinomycetota bacterium]